MQGLGLALVRRLDLPMWRAAAAGNMARAHWLAVVQDLVAATLVRRPVYTVRPVRGM
jgi:hypothetical protein